MLIQYRYLKGKILMLNFDRKLKLEDKNIIFIHICVIWGHFDDSGTVFIYYKKYYLTLILCYKELEVI